MATKRGKSNRFMPLRGRAACERRPVASLGQRTQNDLDPAVLGAAGGRGVVGDRRALAHARDPFEVEAMEALPEACALAQDRQPAQPRLEAFEAVESLS